ncbi:MAG: hypothetical protein CMM02_08240 [Rhodopirellula sp.]|nr:hypothetical protein [Rhodopirellula sp.]MAT10983.1 hypothetical protein [Rhodopirellula sp.]|tara:strand:+ start:291 stop:950 length:660 start_codon:yes stop_codon:yes gene_type:complete
MEDFVSLAKLVISTGDATGAAALLNRTETVPDVPREVIASLATVCFDDGSLPFVKIGLTAFWRYRLEDTVHTNVRGRYALYATFERLHRSAMTLEHVNCLMCATQCLAAYGFTGATASEWTRTACWPRVKDSLWLDEASWPLAELAVFGPRPWLLPCVVVNCILQWKNPARKRLQEELLRRMKRGGAFDSAGNFHADLDTLSDAIDAGMVLPWFCEQFD